MKIQVPKFKINKKDITKHDIEYCTYNKNNKIIECETYFNATNYAYNKNNKLVCMNTQYEYTNFIKQDIFLYTSKNQTYIKHFNLNKKDGKILTSCTEVKTLDDNGNEIKYINMNSNGKINTTITTEYNEDNNPILQCKNGEALIFEYYDNKKIKTHYNKDKNGQKINVVNFYYSDDGLVEKIVCDSGTTYYVFNKHHKRIKTIILDIDGNISIYVETFYDKHGNACKDLEYYEKDKSIETIYKNSYIK